ncbi:catechol 2,3-dioxygenase [Melghirimyces profundicolus]|uniref:Catechol 2,3-dioxygenase n=1 Tax=Melghirimyces profundicolus TaxID=1242148 RepID=A0A2T6C8L9_9BACL|nr:VOC family protein [Melghirimyces profundicolus]PTX64616.1 catechol 2,3-dioxygenase [Melghirimyces profundicolus]
MNRPIHPETEISRVHLTVADLERSLDFYRDTLGFRMLRRESRTAELTADGTTPLVILEEVAEARPKPPGTTGLYHYAILLPERTDLARCLRYLADIGIRMGASDHHFSEALYLPDPDGNGIEIYADRPRELWRRDGELPAVSDPLDVKGLLSLAGDQTWEGFPQKTRIGHVHLHVADLHQAEEFYCEGLDLEPTIRWNGTLFVSAGGYHHYIGLNTWAGQGAPPPPPNSVGLRVFSLKVQSPEEVERIAQRLRQIGAPVETRGAAVLTTDPFENQIRIHP